jgi:hypothetical protein
MKITKELSESHPFEKFSPSMYREYSTNDLIDYHNNATDYYMAHIEESTPVEYTILGAVINLRLLPMVFPHENNQGS